MPRSLCLWLTSLLMWFLIPILCVHHATLGLLKCFFHQESQRSLHAQKAFCLGDLAVVQRWEPGCLLVIDFLLSTELWIQCILSKARHSFVLLTSWLWGTNGKYFFGVHNIMSPQFGGVARINTALRPSWETVFNIFLGTYMRPVVHTLLFNLFIFQALTPQYLFLVTKKSCLQLYLFKGFALHFKLCAWGAGGWVCAHTCWCWRKPKG